MVAVVGDKWSVVSPLQLKIPENRSVVIIGLGLKRNIFPFIKKGGKFPYWSSYNIC